MNALNTLEKKYVQAEAAEEKGQFRRAAQIFRQLTEEEAAEPLFHWKLGYVLLELQEYHSAIKEFRHVLKLDPKNIAAVGGLGRVYMELGKWSLAEKAIRKRLALKRSPQHFVFLAHILMMRGHAHEAVPMCRRAIALDPGFAEAYLNMGLAYRADKKPKKAIAALQKATELDGQYADAFRELGWTCYSVGDVDAAKTKLEKCLELDPEDAWAYLYIALCFEYLGDAKGASRHFRAALKQEPENAVFRKEYDEFLRQSVSSNGHVLKGTSSDNRS